MQYRHLVIAQLLIRHRCVGSAKIDGSGLQLADASARTDRVVVDLNVRMEPVVFGKPLRVNRIWKGGASSIEQQGGFRRGSWGCCRGLKSCAHPCSNQYCAQSYTSD